jgi:hypothetical protein
MKANKRRSNHRSLARWAKFQENFPVPSEAALFHAALVWLVLLALASWMQGGDLASSAGTIAWMIALFSVSSALAWFMLLRRTPFSFKGIGNYLAGLATLALGVTLFAMLFVTWIASGEMRSSPEWPQQLLVATAVASPILFAGAARQASTLPTMTWNARRLQGGEIVLLLLLSLMAFSLLSGALGMGSFEGAATQSQMWMTTVLATGTALFIGQVGLQVLRRPGAAMIVFAAALFYQAFVNFGYAHTLGEGGPGAAAHFLALAAAAAMDVVYMLRLPDADSQASLRSALGVGVLVAFTTAAFFRAPMFGVASLDLPLAAIAFAAAAAFGGWSGWCGARGGQWLTGSVRLRVQNSAEKRSPQKSSMTKRS